MRIAVIGGTGKEGRGLVLRLAALGEDEVLIGSRQAEKARATAEEMNRRVGSSRVDLQACKLEYSIVSPK